MKKLTSALVFSSLLSTSAFADKWHMPTPYGDGNLPTQIAYSFAAEIKEAIDQETIKTLLFSLN